MNRTNLTTGSDADNAAFYQTAPFTPGANRLVLAFVVSAMTSNAEAKTPTLSGAGLTWESVRSATTAANGDYKLTCFRSMSTASTAGTVVIDFAAQVQDFCAWSIFELDGVPTTGSLGADAVVQSSDVTSGAVADLSAPLSAPVDGASQNHTVAALIVEKQRTVSSGAGFTQIDVQAPSAPSGKTCTLQTQEATTPAQSAEWNWTGGNSRAGAIVLEIKAAAAEPRPTLSLSDALAKQFAPVLFLDTAEKVVPVNAQRYVEQASMWQIGSPPDDDKNNWTKFIAAGNISTDPDPSRFLDKLNDGRDCFLELGGWKNRSETPEPDVTATSTNLYANRDQIESTYDNADPEMTPWYHAEVLDVSQMKAVANQGNMLPDYTKTIDRINRNLANAKLLNYYLFFPDHVQSVVNISSPCDNTDSVEVGCRAGDWQCISLLLTGADPDNAATYTPTYIGLTGLRPNTVQYPDGQFYFRPDAFDDDNLTVMKVAQWKPTSGPASGLPATIDTHPKLYVARGTHSVYSGPANETLTPYPPGDGPDYCATRETPRPLSPDPHDNGLDWDEDLLILLAKLLAGAASGFFPAFCVAYYSVFDEDLVPGFGTYIPTDSSSDSTPADQTPRMGPADAITIRPEEVAVDGATTFRVWQSKQAHQQDDRTYDYLVDRDNQQWWPHPDNEHGYYGRWGQQVAADPFGRRSGPHFPNYVRMFLEAFETGLRGPGPNPDFTMGP